MRWHTAVIRRVEIIQALKKAEEAKAALAKFEEGRHGTSCEWKSVEVIWRKSRSGRGEEVLNWVNFAI